MPLTGPFGGFKPAWFTRCFKDLKGVRADPFMAVLTFQKKIISEYALNGFE